MPDPADALIAELCEVGHDAARRGLVLASAGNLSARLPDREAFVITAAGTWFDRLAPAEFSILAIDGTVLGGHPSPSSEWKLHARTYAVRPDVGCVVHLHPQAAVVLDACGHAVRLITLDHAYYLRRVATVPFGFEASSASPSSTSSGISRSPAGEALQTLPPIVAALRNWSLAKWSQASARMPK